MNLYLIRFTTPPQMMASFRLSTVATATNSHRFRSGAKQSHRFQASCNAAADDNNKTLTKQKVDRRSLMMGIGSLFGTAGVTWVLPWATAVPPVGNVKKAEDVVFPVKLDETVKILVKRPAVNRSKEDKEKATEVLTVNGIRFDGDKYVKFDVLVNDQGNETKITAADSEFAGSFAQLPYKSGKMMKTTSGARFGLTELLEDLKAEHDDYVMVTLVPKTGCENLTVSEIKIELLPLV